MNKQHYRRIQRWRLSRNLRKRRVNVYLLEQRVQKLEQHKELAILDSENTADLMNALEIKVNAVVAENKRLKTQVNASRSLWQKMWQWIFSVLAQKGQP